MARLLTALTLITAASCLIPPPGTSPPDHPDLQQLLAAAAAAAAAVPAAVAKAQRLALEAGECLASARDHGLDVEGLLLTKWPGAQLMPLTEDFVVFLAPWKPGAWPRWSLAPPR